MTAQNPQSLDSIKQEVISASWDTENLLSSKAKLLFIKKTYTLPDMHHNLNIGYVKYDGSIIALASFSYN